MPSNYPVTSKLYGGDEALYNSTTASGNIGAPGNYTLTRAYYSPNTKAYELGYLNDGGSYVAPPYNGPGHSFTRAFYSPNNEVYELGWRGGYGRITILNYFKNAIALATIFVENSRAVGRNKGALANSTFIANVKRSATLRKIAIAYQTSLIVSNYLRTKLKEVIVNSINAITSTKGSKRIRSAITNSTWYPQLSKTSKHFRSVTATFINEVFEGRVRHFYRYAKAQITILISSSKNASKVARVISVSLSKTSKALHKAPSALFAPMVNVAKQFAFVRKSNANQAVLAVVTKQSKHKRFGSASVTYEIGTTKFHTFFKLALANITNLVNVRKNRAAKIRVDSINISASTKIGKFKRIANAISINKTQEGKIGAFHRYSTARVINLFTSVKVGKFKRIATADRVMLAKTTKRRATNVKTTQVDLVNGVKSHGFKKIARAIMAPMAISLRIRSHNKSASIIQSVSATVTKSKHSRRFGNVIVTYEIGTNKANTFGRKAVATAVGLIRFGLGLVMNVRAKESAEVQPVNQINFYVTPNNVDVVGEFTAEDDQPGDFTEPFNDLGEDVVPT